jgi:predicted double-glycine peptidase
MSRETAPNPRGSGVRVIPVPPARAAIDCGATALAGCLVYWLGEPRDGDVWLTERKLCKALNIGKWGAEPETIAAAARAAGLEATVCAGMTVDELRALVAAGTPAIVGIQAYPKKQPQPRTLEEWAADWKNGHYVTVVGFDGDAVLCRDPARWASLAAIPLAEFEARWHMPLATGDAGDAQHVAVPIRGARPAALSPVRIM